MTNRARFKPGDVVLCEQGAWGYGTVVEANNPYIMRVDFGGQVGIRPLRITDHWRLATAEDLRQSPEVTFEPEPCGSLADATLARLREEVEGWEDSVRSFEAGFDCIDEYTHDLFFRECLHGVLNAFAAYGVAVPDDLRARIDSADRRFIELSHETEHAIWGGLRRYDKEVYWYYYRHLIR